MKLDELIERVGVDNVAVQVLHESITSAKQRRGYVEVSFGTDCVSMHDIATCDWANVVFVISVKKEAFEVARDASPSKSATAPTPSAIEATAALIANGLVGQASEEDVREVERLINELLGMK
jgi:hypothetical protein